MRTTFHGLALCLGLAGLCAANVAAAQTRLLPGLWEHTMHMKDDSGKLSAAMQQLQKQLASMPSAQRQQMETMMAAQGVDFRVGAGQDGATKLKVCMTQAQVDLQEMPTVDANCTQTPLQRSGDTVRFKFVCKGDSVKSGEGEVTLLSPKNYTGTSQIHTVTQGKPDRMVITQAGQWLSADCGAIKPMPTPKPKKAAP